MKSDISLRAFAGNNFNGKLLKLSAPVIDRLLGLHRLAGLYRKHNASGLDKEAFCKRMLDVLNVNIANTEQFEQLPQQGPTLVVANHPLGGLEGILMAYYLTQQRKDVKILANVGLSMFHEIRDHFIFINPLVANARGNVSAIRDCERHLKNGGLLLVFPAGSVSHYRPEYKRITDEGWDRLICRLANKSNAQLIPLYIHAFNSKLFYNMGRVYYRLRLLMLARELAKANNKSVSLHFGNPVHNHLLSQADDDQQAAQLVRLLCYLNHPDYQYQWPEFAAHQNMKPLAAAQPNQILADELANLPAKQQLATIKHYSVFYAMQSQAPNCVTEITRLRELVFRSLDEGSGEPVDGDQFDATYTHLIAFDNQTQQIIGAYRMGRTDILQQDKGQDGIYLNQMFQFGKNFANQQHPCLEMGRSFIVPEHQKSFYALNLLWRGIGQFLLRHPQYQTLYGTVSLSKVYDARSVNVIEQVLVEPADVSANKQSDIPTNPELTDYLANHSLSFAQLNNLVRSIEPDNKELPILLKQYHKLGAKFHCLGIDGSFADTPGLLLSVDIPSLCSRQLKAFMGKDFQQYLDAERDYQTK